MFIGIDYGEYRHFVCVLDADGQVVLEREVQHGGPQLLALGEELRTLAYGQFARVGIERVGGVLVGRSTVDPDTPLHRRRAATTEWS